MPAAYAGTATQALTNVTHRYVEMLANHGLAEACALAPELVGGINTHQSETAVSQLRLHLVWLSSCLGLIQNDLLYFRGRRSRAVTKLGNLFAQFFQISIHSEVVRFTPPIFSNHKDIRAYSSAA